MMTKWKTLRRLALNHVTLARALGEVELVHLRDTVVREHKISSALVAGGGRPHHGSEAVFTEILDSSSKCLVVNIKHSAHPDVIADLAGGWPFREDSFDVVVLT
jgi:hypothetical protein